MLPFSTPDGSAPPAARASSSPCPSSLRPPSRAPTLREYPLEFLPRKADNYMNSTFANIPTHQRMEAKTAGILEMHASDATPRGISYRR